jgi:hypothetical protein
MSDFGTATLDLKGKSDFRPIFLRAGPKLTEFWNRLDKLKNTRLTMKHMTVLLLAALILSALPVYAGDAEAVGEGVLEISVTPMFFRIAPTEWDGGRAPLSFWSAGLGVEYGIIPWLSPFVKWAPGINLYSDFDAGDFGYLGDVTVGLRGQIIGPQAPIGKESMRLTTALELKIPMPSTGDAGEPDNHLWGTGLEASYDFIINQYFFLNGFMEIFYYPDQPSDNTNFGPGNMRVSHPIDFLIRIEPRGILPLREGALVLKGGLPISYSMSPETAKEKAAAIETRHKISLGPVFTVAFTQMKFPFEISLGYAAAVWGKNDFASHDIILSGKLFVPLLTR